MGSLRLATLLVIPAILSAAPIVLNFESLSDGETVAGQFPGLTFTNTIALEAGISLNEFEFPPASGKVVVADDLGPIEIVFATPVTTFSGLFTYLVPLTLSAFDVSDTLVDLQMSLFATNLALSGDAGSVPNEFLSLSFGDGIKRVVIEGDSFGASFALDDATFESGVQSVPEPETLSLLVAGVLVLGWLNCSRQIPRSTRGRGGSKR